MACLFVPGSPIDREHFLGQEIIAQGNAFIPAMDLLVLPLTLVVAAVVLILVDRMWKKLPPDHPAVYRAPTLVVEDQK